MQHRSKGARLVMVALAAALAVFARPAPQDGDFRGVLLTTAQVNSEQLRAARAQGAKAIILNLAEEDDSKAATRQIRKAGFDLYYWIEIGRNPRLADAHPEWMASLQGHPEWRRFFPNAPRPKPGEVVKNYPWVPVMYQEAFDAHRQRVARLLTGMPTAKGIFLNDLQGAPSACGCGNNLCRWTSDYGPIKTATPLGADAAAQFVAAVAKLSGASVIPVWTTECQAHESAKEGRCAGVPCFANTCWREYTKQLMPLAEQADRLATLVSYKAFDQDLPRYGPTAGWVKEALTSFSEMPPKRQGKPVAVGRVIAVLQGWDVMPAEVQAQIERSVEAGAAGYVVSRMKIEQSWEPKIINVALPARAGSTMTVEASSADKDNYPFILKPISKDQLEKLRDQFKPTHKDRPCFQLNEYGFIESTCPGEPQRVKITDQAPLIERAKAWLVENGKYTGVAHKSDLTVTKVTEIHGCIKCTPPDIDREVIALRVDFEKQMYKGRPLEGDLEPMSVFVDAQGVYRIIGQHFPHIKVPVAPKISEKSVKIKLIGASFEYHDIAGRPQTYKVTKEDVQSAASHVIFVKKAAAGIEFRLAWKVQVGHGLSWIVYVDARTGEELKRVPMFRT